MYKIGKRVRKMHNKTTRILVTIFGGWLGIHKFMDKQIGTGILYLLTGGLFGIGWIVDIIKACATKQYTTPSQYAHTITLAEPNGTAIGNGLYEACIDVAGASYYYDSIVRCMKRNPKYDLPDNDIVDLSSKKIYEFFPLSTNAILTPEPTNRHDVNAVMILVDNNLVGYVPAEYSPFVKGLILQEALSFAEVNILGGNVKTIYPNNDVVISRNSFRLKLKFVYRK